MRRPPSSVPLGVLTVLCVAVRGQDAPAKAPPGTPGTAPRVLFDFETGKPQDAFVLSGKGVIGPRPVPASPAAAAADAPTSPGGKAMRVQGFAKTFVHCKPGIVPADLTPFAAVSVWVHRSEDEAKARRSTTLELQFVEEQGVRYWRKVTVDHAGWQRIELPLRWFSPGGGRLPRWDRVAVLGVYFRDPGELLFDAFALHAGDGPFVRPDLDVRPLAFPGRAPDAITTIERDDLWLMTDVQDRSAEVRALADELSKLRATVVADLGLGAALERPAVIVFAKDADYRAFPPRLAEQLGREARPPSTDGFTVFGIATTSAETEAGLRRPAIVHELVHSVLERHAGLGVVPDWFNEGICAHYQDALRPQADLAERVRRDHVDAQKPRPLSSFCGADVRFRGEYVLALTVARTLLSEPYRTKLPALVEAFRAAKSTDLGPQLGPVLGTDWDGFTAAWRATCERIAQR
jgi:hypothetical protein